MCTEDDNQIEVPPSFAGLYTVPGRQQLLEPASHVRERYELCEDMAQMLTGQAAAAQFKSGGAEGDVLAQMTDVLSAAGSPLLPREARWVVRRIAEILGWPQPLDRTRP
jgi:hypothetical protein